MRGLFTAIVGFIFLMCAAITTHEDSRVIGIIAGNVWCATSLILYFNCKK